jgi:transcriptional regulator with XRE-family HTH domain
MMSNASTAVPLRSIRARRTVLAVDDTPANRKAIGARIGQARLSAGYENAAEFARACNVSPNTVYRWERGEVVPDIFGLESVARVSRVSADWLLRGTVPSRHAAALEEWRKTPRGQTASQAAYALLETLPLAGYEPKPAFFDLVLMAIEQGLPPETAVLAARFTEAKQTPKD